MLRDPDIFLESDRFCPERWLSRSVPAFPTQGFSLAARLCPSQFFARRSIWAVMVGILAALDIPSEFRLGVLSVNTETTFVLPGFTLRIPSLTGYGPEGWIVSSLVSHVGGRHASTDGLLAREYMCRLLELRTRLRRAPGKGTNARG
jgi:hypothetical protein